MSGNVEDRRGLPFDEAAFAYRFGLPDRYQEWQDDEWARVVLDAAPADPEYRALREAILRRQARMRAATAPPAWSRAANPFADPRQPREPSQARNLFADPPRRGR